MAQTQPQPQQFSSQSFSPPVSSPSPGAPSPAPGVAPPPKRQRLSPLPQSQSPFASPNSNGTQLPTSMGQMNGVTTNGASAPTAAPPSTTQVPPPGSMGPPSRPADKATDASELTDVLASSGIDVKEEEAYLTHGYGNAQSQTQPQQQQHQQHQQHQPPRLPTSFNNSFTSQASAASTVSAGNSFTDQTQPKPITTQTQNQFPVPPASHTEPKAPESAAADQKLRQDTYAARREQYHLQSPLLETSVVEERVNKRGYELGVRIPAQGIYRPFPGQTGRPIEVSGPDGSSVIRNGKTLLTHDAALGDIISLLSVACEDRFRAVVEHSASLAKNRRLHSHGSIPMEWSDVAVATTPPNGAVDGSHNRPSSPSAVPQKRMILCLFGYYAF